MAEISYPEAFVRTLELVWGTGFLSPGGPEEVLEILKTIDVRGKRVLDIGCGVGGPAMAIARALGPSGIVGIDVEPQLIEIGRRNVEDAGLRDVIDLRLVEPGPLPFAQERFDVVFSKDALIHIVDKAALYQEIRRVLAPGGVFAASDWLASANAEIMPGFRRYRELSHLHFVMQTSTEAEDLLTQAGFIDVRSRDRNVWYAKRAKSQVDAIAGPLRAAHLQFCSDETYQNVLAKTRANAAAAAEGSLRPTHLFATKPR